MTQPFTSVVTPVGSNGETHYFDELYQFALVPRHEVISHIRTHAIYADLARLDEFLARWQSLQQSVQQFIESEKGAADRVHSCDIPKEFKTQLDTYSSDFLLKKSFSQLQSRFALVEIDKLVAPQRGVNLQHVERIRSMLPKEPTFADLLALCVPPSRELTPIQHLEVGQTHVFTSPNSDLRFLGSFQKRLQPDDLQYAAIGGIPCAAIISFVGYGAAPVSAFEVGKRIVLQNGFHRIFTLRHLGIKEAPIMLQRVTNPVLEFPAVVVQLPREYLLQSPRPVLMGDFFLKEFTINLRIKSRLRVVSIATNAQLHDVPV